MKGSGFKKEIAGMVKGIAAFTGAIGILVVLLLYFRAHPPAPAEPDPDPATRESVAPGTADPDTVENGIHLASGLVAEPGYEIVVRQCTGCHSGELVRQNRMTREGWEATIRWMQETQNLWDLGANEAEILDYLSAYYAPEYKGRRPNLEGIDWYELNP